MAKPHVKRAGKDPPRRLISIELGGRLGDLIARDAKALGIKKLGAMVKQVLIERYADELRGVKS